MSVSYFGDFAEDETVYIPFNTFSSDDPQASVTITNLVDADIKVHKDGGLTQIVTDGATVSIDFDSITGNHLVTIDTSVHADYATGSDYLVRMEGTTVDAGTINAWIGSFSIENRSTTKIHSDTTIIASDLVIVGSDCAAIHSQTTVIESDSVIVESSVQVIESQTTVIESDSITIQSSIAVIESDTTVIEGATGGYAVATLVDDIWDEVLSKAAHDVAQSAGKRLRAIDAAFEVHSGTCQAGSTSTTIVLDTGASATDDIYNGDRVVIVGGTGVQEHGIITDYNGTSKTATMSKAWTITPDNTSEFEIVPADADVEAWNNTTVTGTGDMAQIESDLVVIESDTTVIEAAGGLTAAQDSKLTKVTSDVVIVGSDLVIVGSDCAAIHSQTTVIESDSITIQSSLVVVESQTTVIESQTTVIESDSITIQSSVAVIESQTTVIESDTAVIEAAVPSSRVVVDVTFTSGSTTTAVLGNVDGSAASSTDDFYNGRVLIFNAGTLNHQATDITDYTGATKTATITAVTTGVTASHTAFML